MAGLLFCHLKLLLCLLGLTIALEQTESILKRSRREPLENEQKLESSKSAKITEPADRTKINDSRSRQAKRSKKFNRRRCFLGSPYDCPVQFEDTLLDWPSPWGWGPGPLYPEYGPNLNRGWAGHGGPFGNNHFGSGGPWRVPGCSGGCNNCNNPAWCCCGQEGAGGGGGASDCSQYNDAVPSQHTPNKAGGPPLLHPVVGKQANLKGPVQMNQGKNINVERGNKRYDMTYSPAPDFAEPPPVYEYPNQPTYGNWQVPQQASPADQVVGSLFMWKLKGQNVKTKKQQQRN